jgi:hypothetical protein
VIDHCPACGSHVLYEVTLDYSGTLGFRPDVYGFTPEVGDTIVSCGDCAEFAIVDGNGDAVHAPEPDDQAAELVTVGGASNEPPETPEGGHQFFRRLLFGAGQEPTLGEPEPNPDAAGATGPVVFPPSSEGGE